MNPVRNLAKNNWYVYVIESLKDKLRHTGCPNNLIKRLKDHTLRRTKRDERGFRMIGGRKSGRNTFKAIFVNNFDKIRIR